MTFSLFGSSPTQDSNFGFSHDVRRDEFLSSYTLDDLGLKDSAGLALADVTESQRARIEEEERKRSKRQMWALAIPAITAALTAKDSGQIQRALSDYGQLLDSALARREAVKEKAKDREARKEEFTTSTELEKARLEEVKRSNVSGESIQREGQDITVRGQDIAASTQIRGQDIQVRGQDIQLYNATKDRELTREQAETNRQFQVELEGIQNRHRKDQMSYGAELNNEAVIRNTAIELRDRILTVDPNIDEMVAISAADKLARGEAGDLLEDERNALKLYRIHASETSSAEKARAALNLFTDAMKTPITMTRPDGTPMMSPDGSGPMMRLATPEEALGFVTDARKFLDDIISSPINEDELRTTTGNNVGTVKDQEASNRAKALLGADSEEGRKTRAALSSITSPEQAAALAVIFYEGSGLAASKAIVDASNLPDGFKKIMIKAIEERDILEKQEKDPILTPGSNTGSYLGR